MRPEKFSRNRKHTYMHIHKDFLFFDGFFCCLTMKTLFKKRKFHPPPHFLDEKKYFLLLRKNFYFKIYLTKTYYI